MLEKKCDSLEQGKLYLFTFCEDNDIAMFGTTAVVLFLGKEEDEILERWYRYNLCFLSAHKWDRKTIRVNQFFFAFVEFEEI